MTGTNTVAVEVIRALGIADMSFFGIRFLLLSGLFVYVAIRETRNLKEVRARRLKSS